MTLRAAAAAEGLRRDILAAREETETHRQLPQPIVDALVAADLFRMAVSAREGGPEVDPVEALQVYEELARAEPAVAWCVWNSQLPSLFGRFLPEAERDAVFGNPSSKYAGSSRPVGRAVREDGAYRFRGRWSLVSGCMHADWLVLAAMEEDDDGEIRMLDPGVPAMRLAFVPADRVRIVDTWHVGGLRGTGSHDVIADDLRVPGERTFAPTDPPRTEGAIGRMPISCTMALGHAAICLGISEAALRTLLELGRSKVSVDPIPHLPDREANQELVGRARTLLPALRDRLHRVTRRLWSTAEAGDEPTPDLLADAWSAAVVTGRSCRRLVDELYEAAGTPALYVDNPLERCHRDIHAAMLHVVAQRTWLQEAGRVSFGMEPENPLFGL